MDNASIIEEAKAAWLSRIDGKSLPARWVQLNPDTPPERQVPLKERIKKENKEEIFLDHVRGKWMLRYKGDVVEIITVDKIVETVLEEWTKTGAAAQNKRQWYKEFLTRFAGANREDLESITAGLSPSLYRQYRAKASRPATENSNAQQIQPPGEVNQMPASPIVRPGSAERSMQSPPLAFNHGRCDAATEQQHRLFYDVRRIELLENFSQVRNSLKRKQTHLSELGSVADYLFENGRPARCWTTEQPEDMMDAADYLRLNEMEHLDLMREGKIRKPVVVRDEGFRFRRPKLTLDGVFQEYLSGPQRMVHVQQLGGGVNTIAVGEMMMDKAIELWRQTPESFSNSHPPINLLNLQEDMQGFWLQGVYKCADLLFKACRHSSDQVVQESISAHIGKEPVAIVISTDMKNCMQFRIMAQRGAVSAWHMDNAGVWTWITLEGNTSDDSESDEDVVKYWPFFPMQSLSVEDREEAFKEFAEHGMDWRPTPSIGIPMLALVRGDTLVMPPGTIHAPITLTDCLFTGGMAIHPLHLRDTLQIWEYLCEHPNCTNEDPPRQARSVLDYF
jgi:hypothetical protein